MHPEQQIFCLEVKMKFPGWPTKSPFHLAQVIDIGSLDINGTNRFLFSKDCDYTGVDLIAGPNVDMVCRADEIPELVGRFDCVICTEMLEHDKDWKLSILKMTRLIAPGGLWIVTAAGPARPEHGTYDGCPEASPGTNEYYRNMSEMDFEQLLDMHGLFSEWEIRYGRQRRDIYLWAVKK